MSLSSKEDQIQQRGRGGGISDHSSSRSRNRHRNNRKGSSTAARLQEGEGEDLVGGVTEDCRTAKRKVLESTRLGSYDAYVPECQADGRYQPTQCFKVSSDRCKFFFTKQLYRRTKNVKSSDMRIMATFNSGFVSSKCQTFLHFSVHFHGNVFTINYFLQSSGYCWCVNSTSGRPIPGTSLHNARPNCEAQTRGKEPFQIYLSTILYPFHLVT